MADERIESIRQALKGVFGDPAWLKKAAIGAAINLIPYLGAVWLMGYGLQYQRAVAWRVDEGLPNWRPAEGQWRTGLYAFVVGLAYSLPFSLLLGFAMSAVIMVPAFGAEAGAEMGSAYWVVYSISLVLMMLLMLVIGSALWPVYVHVAMYDRIEAGFQLKRICNLARSNAGTFWTLLRRSLLVMLLSMAASLLVVGTVFGAAMLLTIVATPREVLPIVVLLVILPLELLAFVLLGLIAMPFTLTNYRLWAGYARVAYDLDTPIAGEPAAAAE